MHISKELDFYKVECSQSEFELLLDMLALRAEIAVKLMQRSLRESIMERSKFYVIDIDQDQLDMIQSTGKLIWQHCSDEQVERYESIFNALGDLEE